MTDGGLGQRLRDLAEHAPAPRGPLTVRRALARDRRHRRRRAWTVAALLAVAGTAAIAAVPDGTAPGDAAPTTTPSIYDVATRGSLAGDADFLAGVRALGWPDPPGPRGGEPAPPEDARRVLYAADVPGGGRWALVTGRAEGRLVHAWFTGPTGAAAADLALAREPARGTADQPVTLLDAAGPTGPLVVVGLPGDVVAYSPTVDRDPAGDLRRAYTELPTVDGVAAGQVVSPVTPEAGAVHVVRAGRVVQDALAPTTVGRSYPGTAEDPEVARLAADPRYWAAVQNCLVPFGFDADLSSGAGLGWGGGSALAPEIGALSTAETVTNQAVLDECVRRARGG